MRETCCLHSFFLLAGVKHLNPRQGITTRRRRRHGRHDRAGCVKHLNPRQGITTTRRRRGRRGRAGVKHLNPRQGITTAFGGWGALAQFHLRVKHLNPRQGITTRWCG